MGAHRRHTWHGEQLPSDMSACGGCPQAKPGSTRQGKGWAPKILPQKDNGKQAWKGSDSILQGTHPGPDSTLLMWQWPRAQRDSEALSWRPCPWALLSMLVPEMILKMLPEPRLSLPHCNILLAWEGRGTTEIKRSLFFTDYVFNSLWSSPVQNKQRRFHRYLHPIIKTQNRAHVIRRRLLTPTPSDT